MRRRDFVWSTVAASALAGFPACSVWAGNAAAGSNGDGRKLQAIGRLGNQLELASADVTELRANLKGQLLTPDAAGYDAARKLWNGSFDRRPALIARCAGTADVVQAVNFARAHDLLTAVRGGGHSLSGQSGCDGGLVIDLSALRNLRIDRAAMTATAQPGVLLGELDREAQARGLVTTLGTVADTGIAGLTLGGGLGRLARKFGLTCDNLLSVELVTADGRLLHADASENADLFWAVRGGGGNFGVVTQFEYRLHPFGPNVLGGTVLYPFDEAREVLTALMEFTDGAPDEMYLNPLILKDGNGRAVGFEVCYCGPRAEGERLLAPLRKLGRVLADDLSIRSYLDVQGTFEPGLPAGRGYYFKSGFMSNVSAGMVDEMVDLFRDAPPSLMDVPIIHLGGAAGRVRPDATAFWNRAARHDLAVWATWENGADTARNVAEIRGFWRKLEHLTRGYYINTDVPDDESRLRETYGGNYARLVQIKNQYDPLNRFRLNANIKPTV